jgi:hypothetical protein
MRETATPLLYDDPQMMYSMDFCCLKSNVRGLRGLTTFESDNVDDLMTAAQNWVSKSTNLTLTWKHVRVDNDGNSVYHVFDNGSIVAIAIVRY